MLHVRARPRIPVEATSFAESELTCHQLSCETRGARNTFSCCIRRLEPASWYLSIIIPSHSIRTVADVEVIPVAAPFSKSPQPGSSHVAECITTGGPFGTSNTTSTTQGIRPSHRRGLRGRRPAYRRRRNQRIAAATPTRAKQQRTATARRDHGRG